MLSISLKPDIGSLQRDLTAFARRQLPFAASRAVTEVAKTIAAAETARLPQVLDRPTPFTMRAFAVRAATKANPTAVVYARPVQAAYLAPEEFSAPQKLAVNASAELVPVDAALNQYGNIPRGAVQRWKGRANVFVGTVRGVGGVWQRLRGGKLRLLVRFAAPVVPRVRLGFRDTALQMAPGLAPAALRRQLAAALATAR